jgi:hypothetical protein
VSTLSGHLSDYLALRRALGFKLDPGPGHCHARTPASPCRPTSVTVQNTPSPRQTNPTKQSPYIIIYNDAIIRIFSDSQQRVGKRCGGVR